MNLSLNPTWKQSQISEHRAPNCIPWPYINNAFNSESNEETKPNKWTYCIEWHALAITYKVGTTGDIPATEVLIKGSDRKKHIPLRQERNENMVSWVQKPRISNEFDSESNLETKPNKRT
jgi:hypothetical protein